MNTTQQNNIIVPQRKEFHPLLIVMDILGLRGYDQEGIAVSSTEMLIIEKLTREGTTAQRYDIAIGPSTGNTPEGTYYVPIFSWKEENDATIDALHFLKGTPHDRCIILTPSHEKGPWLFNKHSESEYNFQPFLETTLQQLKRHSEKDAQLAERIVRLSKEYQATSRR